MSTTIDQRVVEMQFDNRHFEQNVSTTMSSLEKLKTSLKLDGATRGLENIDHAAKKCDMSALGAAVESLQLKFSELQVMGITALANITNSAVNAGKQIVSSLTITPVRSGFSEYELKMGSIQTIMASTGENLETVNGYLNELNEYSDKTIYSFSDMTQNIGKFTNAGVKLQDAVLAIQGISNVAAVSGANANEASRAMYNFAQALSAGHVKLMDWKSIELANMATQEFKNYLLEAAVNAGTLTKTSDGMYKTLSGTTLSATKNFNESLQDQWMTTDVLISTLKDYADETTEIGKKAFASAQDIKTLSQLYDTLKESAQSGWAQTWELIVGDLEEAKDTRGEINKFISGVLQASADARNNLLKGWKDAGGRADLVESLFNIIKMVSSIAKPIKEAFHDIIPPLTVDRLVKFTKSLKDFTAKLTLSDSASDKLRRTFRGVFAVVDLVFQAIKSLAPVLGIVDDLGGGILDVTARLGDWLVKVSETTKKTGVFKQMAKGLTNVLKYVGGAIAGVVETIESLFKSLGGVFKGISTEVSNELNGIGSSLEDLTIIKVLGAVWKGLVAITKGVLSAVKALGDGLANIFGQTDFASFLDSAQAIISGGLGLALTKFVNTLKDGIGGFADVFEGICKTMEAFRGVLVAYQTTLKAKALIKIASAIAILVAAVLLLAMVDSDKLYDSIIAITVLFAGLMGTLAMLSKNFAGIKGIFRLNNVTTMMIKIAASVFILAMALKSLAGLGMENLVAGVFAIVILAETMVLVAQQLERSEKSFINGTMSLVIFAAAIKILASAVVDMAGLNFEQISVGLAGVGGLLVGVMWFLNNTKFEGKSIATAAGVVLLAAAMKILASACADFAWLSTEELIKSLTAIAVLLAAAAGFTRIIGNAGKAITAGIAMLAISAAMKIFASAAKDMAELTWDDLARGLVGMAGALVAVIIAVKLMPKNLMLSAIGLVVISSALLILAKALTQMGGMGWSGVVQSLTALGGSLLLLAVGLKALRGTASGAGALVVAAGALAILTPVLLSLGGMSWGDIARGLIVIAAAFTIVGVAGALLKPVVPTLWSLAGVFMAVGAAVALVGTGLLLAGMGLTGLATGLGALAGSLVVTASAIVGIVRSFVLGVLTGIGDGIIALCRIIADGAPAIGEAIKALVLTACDVLVECVPVLANALLVLIVALLESLVEFTPKIVDALFRFIYGILDSLGRHIPKLVQKLVDFFAKVFKGVIDVFANTDPSIIENYIKYIGLITAVMIALAGLSALAPAAMMGVLAFGAIVAELALVLSAIGALALIPGLTWIVGKGGDLLEAVGTTIGRFIGGIAGGVARGFTSSLPEMGDDLSRFMDNVRPFIEGARMIDDSVVHGVQSLVKMVLAITAADVIQSMTSWVTGSSSIGTFASELPALGRGLKSFSDSVAGINTENVIAASNAALVLAKMTSTIPNEGGIAAWFAGENSISKYGTELPALGKGLKGFSDSVEGINGQNIIAAAEAAKTLTAMTSTIPNEGGVAAWFAGENSISKFANDIITLGMGLKGFSIAVSGIVPGEITAAASAAKSLAEMTKIIPNEGGVVAWFTGENSITRFADDMVTLGYGLKGFALAVYGIVPEQITAAANAAKAIAQMTTYIPNQGGMVAWFTGDNSVSKFANKLPGLGKGLKGFGDAVAGVNCESMNAAANAAKTLAEMTNTLPNQGGVVAWFAGETSISKFGNQLQALGTGLKGFGTATEGITPDKITAAAGAAKALAEMTNYIPNSGGVIAWFTGETSIANFAHQLPALGRGLKGFSVEVAGINGESMTAAATAAKSLAEMTSIIPTEGGIKAWFTGETSIAKFADKLPALGRGLRGFAVEVGEINGENVKAAASAAKSLAQMTESVPKNTDKLVKFGSNLATFGDKLKAYFTKTSDITAESVSTVSGVIEVVERVSTLESGNIKSVSKAIEDIGKSLKGLSKVPKDSAAGFKQALGDVGKAGAEKLVKALESIHDDTKKAGENAMHKFVEGVKSVFSDAEKACKSIATSCADAIRESSSEFSSAGSDLVDGFSSGISANSYKAAAKARAMAQAAAQAAKDELDINSPSKVFRAIGTSVPEGFAVGIDKFIGLVKNSSNSMANTAVGTVSKTISTLADMVSTDIDSQPTIRPVLDLSDIKSGAKSLNGLLGMGASIGVSANIGAINSMMNGRVQNGNNDDVISAIDKLGKVLAGRSGDTYNIGVTDNDDANVQEAVRTIVRAARIGGRV